MRRNFVFMGQSNASGRGNLADVPAYANIARMFLYGNDGVWKAAAEPVDSPVGQVDASLTDTTAGAGAAMAFANRICTLYGADEVGLVPANKGSTSIVLHRRLWSRKYIYGAALARIREAEALGTTAGIVWWQGEADTGTAALAAAWPERFANLIANIRADLGNLNLPVVFVQLNSLSHKEVAWNRLRALQADIKMKNVAMVPSAGWEFSADKVHCTTAGYQTAGVDIANAMAAML